MNRNTLFFAALLLLVALVAVPAAAQSVVQTTAEETTTFRLVGVVNEVLVHHNEIAVDSTATVIVGVRGGERVLDCSASPQLVAQCADLELGTRLIFVGTMAPSHELLEWHSVAPAE